MGDYSEMFVLGDFNFEEGVQRHKFFNDLIRDKIFAKGFEQIVRK